jgi:ApbE superfamily uncharacterized protein (UPF0280 family)
LKERFYREWVKGGDLVQTICSYKETDLCIMAERSLEAEALKAIKRYRDEIEGYIELDPVFKDALEPVIAKPGAPPIVTRMAAAGKAAGVGPMAAVAGAIAESVGRDLLERSKEIVVENGGDIFIASGKDRVFGVYAGSSPLTGRLKFEIMAQDTPLGVCTSSGSVGPSLSYGKADAACVVSKDTALADAVATKTGNIVKTPGDIEKGIAFAANVPGVMGCIVIIGEKMGSWGRIKLIGD